VVVSGAFDDLRSRQIRLLQEAARLGPLTVLLWSDESILGATGAAPRFPQAEREYLLKSIRFVTRVEMVDRLADPDALPSVAGLRPDYWVIEGADDSAARRSFCAAHGISCRAVQDAALATLPEPTPPPAASSRKRVIVTGCYDWLHSGHVRFFEEVSGYGDLYVVVGHDANVRLLKGEPHPMHSQAERCYCAGSIRFVTQALVSTGHGWLDAEPEMDRLRPDIYAVNEDGDKGGKREFCEKRGIEYLVLKRTPAAGLPRRSSTDLRGF
jgi:cytidyltransferase-like protein